MGELIHRGVDAGPTVVLLDANVLYSRALSDYFVRLQAAGAVMVRWSSPIVDEVVRNKKKAAIAGSRNADDLQVLLAAAEALRTYTRTHYAKSFVEPTEEHFACFADLPMPDPDDRHVLAAAVAANANYLCTSNVADFPDPLMERTGIQRFTPDALLDQFTVEAPMAMLHAHHGALGWTRGATHRGMLDRLRRAGAPTTADRLERLLKSLGNLDSTDDLAKSYESLLAERDRARAGLLPPTNRRLRTGDLRARPIAEVLDRQRLGQQRGIGG